MLDAAEYLLRTGGADALTVEAVIEQAGTSTGSFYARFGSREGLFVAMHERFLTTFGAAMASVVAQAQRAPTVETTVRIFVSGLFTAVRQHRDTLAFHMLHNAHNTEMRAQGNAFTQQLAGTFAKLVTHHQSSPRRTSPSTLDMANRMMLAMALEMALFEDDEATGRSITARQFTDRFTEMLLRNL